MGKKIIRSKEEWKSTIKTLSGFHFSRPIEMEMKAYEPKRSNSQNALLWSRLSEVAEHVEWHGQHLSAEDWKDVFTASLKAQRVVPGIDSGFVMVGSSTSKMSVAEMGDLLELIVAFGIEKGVEFND